MLKPDKHIKNLRKEAMQLAYTANANATVLQCQEREGLGPSSKVLPLFVSKSKGDAV